MLGCQKIDALERAVSIDHNRREYAEHYDELHFIVEANAEEALAERGDLLKKLISQGVLSSHGGSKLDTRKLSPGCRACGSGDWSCLFINGICNMSCFYCPTQQTSEDVPQTNTVPFADPRDYVDYLKRFNFTGVSISGGEPLLTYEKTLRYIRMVRKSLGDGVHIWMYTNGTLASRERLLGLRDAGLNEIRFDIGAVGYRLEPLSIAAGIFDVLTVEIPSVPEDFSLLSRTIPRLKEAGVQYLNLHQLRLTPYNLTKLSGRNYTFLHGPKVTVLESELTALKLMLQTFEQGVDLPINYCSFIYKDTYQKAAARRRGAEQIKKGHEDLTKRGFIRNLSIGGSAEKLESCTEHLKSIAEAEGAWFFDKGRGRIHFKEVLWKYMDFTDVTLFVKYDITAIRPELSYGHVFKTLDLNKRRKVYVERRPLGPEISLLGYEIESFWCHFIEERQVNINDPRSGICNYSKEFIKKVADLESFERCPEGLYDYY